MNERRLSIHILPTAATMIGVCITVIGLIKLIEGAAGKTPMDEVIALDALGFLASAALSYVSLRSAPAAAARWEAAADRIFIASLAVLTLATLGIAFLLA